MKFYSKYLARIHIFKLVSYHKKREKLFELNVCCARLFLPKCVDFFPNNDEL